RLPERDAGAADAPGGLRPGLLGGRRDPGAFALRAGRADRWAPRSPLADPRARRRAQGPPRRAGGRRRRAGAGGEPGRAPGALAAVRVQHHPSAPGRAAGRPAVRRRHPDRPRPRLPGGHGLAPPDAPGPVDADRSEAWIKGKAQTLDVSRRTAEAVVIGAGVMGASAVRRGAGLRDVGEVGPDDIRRLSPAVRADDLIGGTFGPTDGYIVPLEIMRGFIEAAQRLGVQFEYDAGWVECVAEGGRIAGVRTPEGVVGTRRVVNAAGPWAGLVARTAGVDIPVGPLRRQTAVTQPFPRLPADTPMTINVDDGFHFRVRDGRIWLLWPEDLPADDPFDVTFDRWWLDGLLRRAH